MHLDIKEEIDFSFDDVDQIKAKEYDKEYLIKAGYSLKYSFPWNPIIWINGICILFQTMELIRLN